jgi:hypothetical protein
LRFVAAIRRFVASHWEGTGPLPTSTSNASPDAPRRKEPTMTTENLFSAVLTFSLLAGGAVAFGSDLVQRGDAASTSRVATLPTVTVVGKRIAASDDVTLPTVTVIGRRATPTRVAIETETVDRRVQ